MRRDRWREFLARVLPWFDEVRYDREREQTRMVLEQADRVMKNDPIREAYRLAGQRLDR